MPGTARKSGLMTYSWINFFFFFQAEDGIRDADVTGVQTCALPIFAGIGGGDCRDPRENLRMMCGGEVASRACRLSPRVRRHVGTQSRMGIGCDLGRVAWVPDEVDNVSSKPSSGGRSSHDIRAGVAALRSADRGSLA